MTITITRRAPPSARITNGITVTLMFYSILSSQARSKYLSLFLLSLISTPLVLYWSLSESKSPHVSRTLLNILADLNNIVVWMVLSLPLISIPLIFSQGFWGRSKRINWYHHHPHVSQFIFWSTGSAKSIRGQGFFFLVINIRSSLLTKIRYSVWISKSQRTLCLIL